MAEPKHPDRWDGWDDPDYKPTPDELNEPLTIDADPEDVAAALMHPRKAIPS